MDTNKQLFTANHQQTEPMQTKSLSEVPVAASLHAEETYSPGHSLLSAVLVPRAASTREIAALETAMQGLVLDARHPVALELVGTASSRQFLLRSTSPMALRHLEDQVQARYPQARIHPVAAEDDPLQLREGETVSVVELRAGAAAYLPLRNWHARDLEQEGADPLLGLLAVFNHLPSTMRVVSQLALIPAPPTWSQDYRRKSVEHPLEQERTRQRRDMGSFQTSGPSTLQLVGMGVLVALLLLWLRFKRQVDALIPAWLLSAASAALHGKTPVVTAAHLITLEIAGIVGLISLFSLAFVIMQISSHMSNTPIYDMRLVAEKTARPAYRVRLRLFVFASPVDHAQSKPSMPLSTRLQQHVPQAQALSWSSLSLTYRAWRETARLRTDQRQELREALDHLIAAYRQYHNAAGGYFVPHRLSPARLARLLRQRRNWGGTRRDGWTTGLSRSPHLLSVADVAALWHLPQTHDLADLPYLERSRARTLLAPVELTHGDGWQIGTSRHAGQCVPVYLPQECFRHNLLTVASTGKGKSTLFQHLAQAIFAARADAPDYALAFIEPHGDVIHALCGLIPPAEQDQVTLIDLANTDYPVGINPLDMVGKDRDKAVDTLITIAEHLWEASYGSRTENVLEYALKTLADANAWIVSLDPQQGPDRQYTLLDVVPLLSSENFRHTVLEQVHDLMLADWWEHYYEPLDARQQREITSSVITKVSKFASSRIARGILGQPRSTIDLLEIIRAGRILLVSTASGVVGSDLSELIGIVLLGLFEAALAEQANVPAEQRRRYLVLIDEFQVYRGANYQAMLAELRKYGGSFGLATQSLAYLDRLDRTLRATVLANIDHLFAFHMAGEDARLLHELDGIDVEDIINLDDFQCYVKLSLHGRRLPVFSLDLLAPAQPNEEGANAIRRRSQQRDARPVGVVDAMIQQSRVRQCLASQTRRRTVPRTAQQRETSGDAESLTPRKKRRGKSNRTQEMESVAPQHLHLMYGDANAVPNDQLEDTERDRNQARADQREEGDP